VYRCRGRALASLSTNAHAAASPTLGRNPTTRHPSTSSKMSLIATNPSFRRNRSATASRTSSPSTTRHAPNWGDSNARPARRLATRPTTFRSKSRHFETLCREWAPGRRPNVRRPPCRRACSQRSAAKTSQSRRSRLRHDDAHRPRTLSPSAKQVERHMESATSNASSASGLLTPRRDHPQQTRLMCFSGAGFTTNSAGLRDDRTIQLVDLERLYRGE